jgi:hypothetical protein
LWGPPSRAFCTTASASGTEPCSSYFWTSSWWVTLLLVARHQHDSTMSCWHCASTANTTAVPPLDTILSQLHPLLALRA